MKNILLICTGNTCRSPMAEAMLDSAVKQSDILNGEIKTDSAGTFAFEGSEPAAYAKAVMKEMGLSLDRHRSKQVDRELVRWADLILTMDAYGQEQMLVMFPEAEAKIKPLKCFMAKGEAAQEEEYNIEDPYGADLETYRACAEEIKACVEGLVKQLEALHR